MAEYSAPSEAELSDLLQKTFTSSIRTEYTSVNGFSLPQHFHRLENDIKNFEVRDSDVWICGFPKTGTTWASEISWLITNDLDYEGAKELDYLRTGILDMSFLFDVNSEDLWDRDTYMINSIGYCQSLKNPRSIKTHLPFFLIPDQIQKGTTKAKVIYTMRDPMDVCVSYYYQCANYENFSGTFDEFCKLFLFGKINYGPYHQHIKTFWEAKKNPNFLFLTYEEMNRDLSAAIRKIADFLGKELTDKDVAKLRDYVSFDNMKKNPAVNKEDVSKLVEASGIKLIAPFIRAGKVGGYKSKMSDEYVKQFKYWKKEWFKDTGIEDIFSNTA